MQDATGRLPRLWAQKAFAVRETNEPGCWGTDGAAFFKKAASASSCNRNWYEGSPGKMGAKDSAGPSKASTDIHFKLDPDGKASAPALLGFDEHKDLYCAHEAGHHGKPAEMGHRTVECISANVNTMSLGLANRDIYATEKTVANIEAYMPEYNMCTHLEWLMCAARGRLPGQGSTAIRFATKPQDVFINEGGQHPLGSCSGESNHPRGCGHTGFSSSDVFYLEVCTLSQICKNWWKIFFMEPGGEFHCDLTDSTRYDEFRNIVLDTTPSDYEPFSYDDRPTDKAAEPVTDADMVENLHLNEGRRE